jgi:tryptophan halogenase
LRGLHALLGVPEADLVRSTRATYRLATEHRGWQGEGSLFLHAHGDIGMELAGTPFYKYLVHQALLGNGLIPEEFSIAAQGAVLGRFARPMGDERSLTASFTYGYHLDDRAYASLLRRHAATLRVAHDAAELADVELATTGAIDALKLSNGTRISADLYIDCTGSSGALISRVDRQPPIDWSDSLPCDRMLTGFGPALPDARAMTQTLADEHGWFWRVPLADATAHGRVFSSDGLSDEEALRTLQGREVLDSPMFTALKAQRRAAPWSRNCIALGSAAVQLEPLAGADLQAAALGIGTLVELFPVHAPSDVEAAEYNRVMAEHFDGLRDFTLAHYHCGAARAGALWARVRAAALPDRLAHKLDLYFANARIQLLDFETFEETDWAWLLLGGRRTPASLEVQIQQRMSQVPPEQVARLREQVARLVSTMPRHMDVVKNQNPVTAGPRVMS